MYEKKQARRILDDIDLNLSGLCVYTEAATGAYCVTAGLAAMAGAEPVYALARDSRFGNADEAAKATLQFARDAGVEDRLRIVSEKSPTHFSQADIVTNSGHVRPIDANIIGSLKATAVVPLMYEAWEYRPQDLDLATCRDKGIPVVGTNESHPVVGILDYLGMMAVKLLVDGGIDIAGTRIAIWSDNKFCAYIAPAFVQAGADVSVSCPLPEWQDLNGHAETLRYVSEPGQLRENLHAFQDVDVVILVMSPNGSIWVGEREESVIPADDLAEVAPGATVAQFWGAVHRGKLLDAGLQALPAIEPSRGHMGILPSELGAIPMLRMQSGGLKVGEIMARARLSGAEPREAEQLSVNAGFGQIIPA